MLTYRYQFAIAHVSLIKYRYHKGNYKIIINIDLSDVVIEQQQKNFPGQEWLVMDAMDMSFEDGHFPYIIDKSLIDTIMCSENGYEYVINHDFIQQLEVDLL